MTTKKKPKKRPKKKPTPTQPAFLDDLIVKGAKTHATQTV